MMKYIKRVGSAIGTGARAFVVLVGIAGVSVAVANYAVTQGAGTNFGSVVVGGIHYAQQFICDLTTPSQCAVVDASGKVGVKDSDVLAAVQAAVPAGTNLIGKVGIDQTTPGTTNAVAATNLPTTADTNSGNKSASTLRVVLATDQPALSNKLLVTPDSVALPANQSVNTAQVNGVTTLTGTGATGTGAQRVTVSTDQATNAGAALVKGGVGTVNGGSDYETVAASQTGQALGATGATGDYLSHCVIYPTTTTPGVVTVFDNTNAAGTNVIAFPGGASSVSNLVPIAIPVGAISTAGAWKVTTGANLVVTCYGKFT